jgi:hypothetical protein
MNSDQFALYGAKTLAAKGSEGSWQARMRGWADCVGL